ncbi:hypothetical protein [Thermococcus sp.]|uniref:hypothetical protein n=1 Tax=Thermococcus sp. TaxID=35749 RepID=UPI0026201A96|nr:hypothetical protein [Thermococcus sp.]
MKEVLKRAGVEIAEVITADGRKALEMIGEGIADRIMLDAPCTSDGTIAKNPELRWRLREKNMPKVASLQKGLIESAWRLLKPGGRLLYQRARCYQRRTRTSLSGFWEGMEVPGRFP